MQQPHQPCGSPTMLSHPAPGYLRRSTRACVVQGAAIRPAAQSNRAASGSPSSSSRDEGESHHASGFEETDPSSDDTGNSSSSHNDSDSDSGSGSDGGAYQQSTRSKHTGSRGQCRRKVTVRSGQAVAPPAAAAAAGTSSLTSGPEAANTQHCTHAHALPSPQCTPPRLVWCQSALKCTAIKIPSSLYTDISTGCETTASTGLPVQLSVVVHPAQWSVKEFVLSQQPGSTTAARGASAITSAALGAAVTSGPAQHAGGEVTDDQAEAGSTVCLGPFTGFMKQNSNGVWVVRQLQHSRQLCPYNTTHQVVLAERVLGADMGPTFKLHIQPGRPQTPRNQFAKIISHAGDGMGLQVFPGGIDEIVSAGTINLKKGKDPRMQVTIPKLLICSRLPVDAVYPLEVSLRVVDKHSSSAGSGGPWELDIYTPNAGSGYPVRLSGCHPLSAYAGRSIVRMSLSTDRQLTFHLAPPVASEASAGGVGDTQAAVQETDTAPPAAAGAATASQHHGSMTEQEPATAGTMQPKHNKPPKAAVSARVLPGVQTGEAAAGPEAVTASTLTASTTAVGHDVFLGPQSPLLPPHSRRASSNTTATQPATGSQGSPASPRELVPAMIEGPAAAAAAAGAAGAAAALCVQQVGTDGGMKEPDRPDGLLTSTADPGRRLLASGMQQLGGVEASPVAGAEEQDPTPTGAVATENAAARNHLGFEWLAALGIDGEMATQTAPPLPPAAPHKCPSSTQAAADSRLHCTPGMSTRAHNASNQAEPAKAVVRAETPILATAAAAAGAGIYALMPGAGHKLVQGPCGVAGPDSVEDFLPQRLTPPVDHSHRPQQHGSWNRQQVAPPMHFDIPGSSNHKVAPSAADATSNQPPAAAVNQQTLLVGRGTPCAGLTPSKRPVSCMTAAVKQEQPEGGHGTVGHGLIPVQAAALQADLLVVKQEGGASGSAGADTAAAGPAAVNKRPRLPPHPHLQQQQQPLLQQPALASPTGGPIALRLLHGQQHRCQAGKAPAAINTTGHGTTHKMAAILAQGSSAAQLSPNSAVDAANNGQQAVMADVEMTEAAPTGPASAAAVATGLTVQPGTVDTRDEQVLLTVPGRSTPRAAAATGRTTPPAPPTGPLAPLTALAANAVQPASRPQAPIVCDLTLDSDDEADKGTQQPTGQYVTEANTGRQTSAAAIPAQAEAQGQAAGAASSLPPGAVGTVTLPSGLQLQDVTSPRQMEQELVGLMTQGLRGLLPREQYCNLMEQLLGCFEPYRLATVSTNQLRQLHCMYAYVQAAVDGGQLKAVLTALRALIVAA